jgi:hypothetical protein
MGRMDRNVNIIVLATVTMTLAMLCLVCVYLVVEKDGWAHSVNSKTVTYEQSSYGHTTVDERYALKLNRYSVCGKS